MRINQLSLSSLKYFIDSVESRSLTRAAELNFVTRPAISQSILRLEQWTGFPLLIHEKKSFELTAEGEDFYRKVKKSYLGFEASMLETAQGASKLKIGCSISLADHFLIPTLKKFSLLPNLELRGGTSNQLLNALEDQEIHLAVYVESQLKSFTRREICTQVLKKGQFQLYSKQGQLPDIILTTKDRFEVSALKKALLRKSSAKNVKYAEVDSWSLCIKLAQELDAACLVPDCLIATRQDSRSLKIIKLSDFRSGYQVNLSHLRPEFLSISENQLLKYLVNLK